MGVSKTLTTNTALCTINILSGATGITSLYRTVKKDVLAGGSTGLSPMPTVVGYEESNLLKPQRRYKFRTPNALNSELQFFFTTYGTYDANGVYGNRRYFTPTVFGIIGANTKSSPSGSVSITGSESPDFSSAVLYSGLSLYDSTVGDVVLWYLDTPTSGTISSSMTYWKIYFTPDSSWTDDTYFECSSFFLGVHREFDIDYGGGDDLEFYSKAGMNYSGSRFYEEKGTTRTVDIDSTLLDRETRRAVLGDIRMGRNNTECILDKKANVADSTDGRGDGLYYGYLSAKTRRSLSIDGYQSVSLSLTESP